MRIPESIRIGPYKYKVEILETPKFDNEDVMGVIKFNGMAIELKDNMNPQMRDTVWLHEILHGILNHAEINLEDELEEQIVNIISRGLYQVYRDNKEVFDYVTGD